MCGIQRLGDEASGTCERCGRELIGVNYILAKSRTAQAKKVKMSVVRDFARRMETVINRHRTEKSGLFHDHSNLIEIFEKIDHHLRQGYDVTIVQLSGLQSEVMDGLISTVQTTLSRELGYFVDRFTYDMEKIGDDWKAVILFKSKVRVT
jgi:hypothetical protein